MRILQHSILIIVAWAAGSKAGECSFSLLILFIPVETLFFFSDCPLADQLEDCPKDYTLADTCACIKGEKKVSAVSENTSP